MVRLNLLSGEVDMKFRGKGETLFFEKVAYYSGGFGREFSGVFVNNVLVYPEIRKYSDEDLFFWTEKATTGSLEDYYEMLPESGGLEYVSTSSTLFSLHLESSDRDSTDAKRVLVSVSGVKPKGEMSTDTLSVTREVLDTTESLEAILRERIPFPRRVRIE
jgi:hypothetical protein